VRETKLTAHDFVLPLFVSDKIDKRRAIPSMPGVFQFTVNEVVDQAKQAYTSFEMVEQGNWLYQHTPNESVATKPPLIGWISAALFEVTHWWEGAWRIPSLAAALALFWLIAKDATTAYGADAGLIALSAFGLNLLSPRIATLVRTDMPLALVTFLIGRQVWLKICRAEVWRRRDRAVAFVLLASAMLIKGPIICLHFAGAVVYQILRRKRGAPRAWTDGGRGFFARNFSRMGDWRSHESAGLLRKCGR
jgi:4-amino-4-deoxy-L-arabinose transferase-like glycosyltransferase